MAKAAPDKAAPTMELSTVPAWMALRAVWGAYTPETRMTSAVTVQTSSVAIKTSKRPHMPSSAGSSTSAAACAMAEEPRPWMEMMSALRR